MKIQRGYKVELDPNNKQRTALLRHAGAARWAYNWGLRRKIDEYEAGHKSPTAMDLHKELVRLKHTPESSGGIPWLKEVSKCAPQQALRDLDRAYANFFRRVKQGAAEKGFPRFKSRKREIGSFYLQHNIRVVDQGRKIQLPRLGQIRLKERGYLPGPDQKDVRILSATVSEKAGRWFVSVCVEEEAPEPSPGSEILGVDLGISKLATLSDGTVFDNPRALKKGERRLRRLQKSLSRKQKGSKNREKAKRKVQRQHLRISNIRKDHHHKSTTVIIKRASFLGVESLNIKGLMRNRRLSKALADASLGEFLRQLKYKAAWRGVTIVEAYPFYASSRTCSCCSSYKEDLTLADQTYRCEYCEVEIDRDVNAAINLWKRALIRFWGTTDGSSGSEACGEDVRPNSLVSDAASVKQEPDSEAISCLV